MIDRRLAEHFRDPVGKVPALAQFNKITGELTAVLGYVDPETLNNEFFVYREIEIDFENEVFLGNLESYRIVNKHDLPQDVYEYTVDEQARDKITKLYPLVEQVNVLGRAIQKLSSHAGIDQEELQEMLDYIEEVKHANRLRKEFYQNSPDFNYITDAELEEIETRQLEGGLHEAYGPRPSAGGRVF